MGMANALMFIWHGERPYVYMSAQVCRERARERPRESAFAGAMALQPRDKAARQRKREKAVGTLNELAASLDGEPPMIAGGRAPPVAQSRRVSAQRQE